MTATLTALALDLLLDGHFEVLEILKSHGFSVNLQHPRMQAFLSSAESSSSDDEPADDEEPDDDPSSDNPTEASKSHTLITAVNLGFPKLVEQALAAGG